MSAETLQNLLYSTGRLVINPTDLTAAYPFGGTELGFIQDTFVEPTQVTVPVRAEEWGNVVVDTIDGGRGYILGANVRGGDDDAMSTFFPKTVVGSATGRRNIRETTTGAPRAGSLGSARTVDLVFAPDDLRNHRMVQIPRAIPLIDESASLAHQLSTEQIIGVLFMAIPDATGALYNAFFQADGP